MPRFLHTSDWQIGRKYGRFTEDDSALLAEARFTAIERIAELAVKEKTDAVLVAGDVFDAQTVSDRTIHRTFQAMSGCAGPWIIIPGNHDAALAESVWTRARRLNAVPANVTILLEPQPALFAAEGFAILPAPLTQRQTHHDLTDWFDRAETPAGLLRIGLAHGSVSGQLPESADSPNPIAPSRAETASLDYLALGDWHGAKQINNRVWYSGTPEQERFKDNGAGQVLVVQIDRPGADPVVEQRRVGQHQWVKQEHSIAVESDLHKLCEALDQLPSMAVVHLSIRGSLSLEGRRCLLQALGAAGARHRSLQYDIGDLRLLPTDEDIAALKADGYVGEVIEELRQRQGSGSGDSNAEAASEALAILASLLDQQATEAPV